MYIPEFNVTGIVLAVGHTILTWLCLTSANDEAHPCPVSPSPCRNINVAVCLPLGDTMTGAIFDLLFPGLAEAADFPFFFDSWLAAKAEESLLLAELSEDFKDLMEQDWPIYNDWGFTLEAVWGCCCLEAVSDARLFFPYRVDGIIRYMLSFITSFRDMARGYVFLLYRFNQNKPSGS